MYRVFFILASLVFSLPLFAEQGKVELVVGEPETCRKVLDAVQNHLAPAIIGFPSSLAAGQRLSFQAHLQKTFTLNQADWLIEYSDAFFFIETDQPYPHLFKLDSSEKIIDFLFSSGETLDLTVTKEIPPHFNGRFSLKFQLVAITPSVDYCIVRAVSGSDLTVTSDRPDMVPPLVQDITFDHKEYKPGDTVTLRLTLSEPLEKPQTNHLEFKKSGGGTAAGFPGYLSDRFFLFQEISHGVYEIQFSIPMSAEPGAYVLTWFNRIDIPGNFEGIVGNVDQKERAIAENNPLVIH